MNTIERKESVFLFAGDILVLFISLILTLVIRYRALPSWPTLESHLAPFSILFVAFILVNFIAGLYEKHTITRKHRIPVLLLNVQIIDAVIGVAFFYFIPYFAISPRFFLFIYLVTSLILMSVWRILIVPQIGSKKSQRALLIGVGKEVDELRDEVNNNSRYHITFVDTIAPARDAATTIANINNVINVKGVSVIVIDSRHPLMAAVVPELYPYSTSGILFMDLGKMYEDIFDRVPLSMMGQAWFVENMSSAAPKFFYDTLKRLIDITLAGLVGLVSLIFYPFIILAIKIEDRGDIFFYQKRIGQFNKTVRIIKFRTMTMLSEQDRHNLSTAEIAPKNTVTRVGRFLRMSRLDELPQLWNVIRGDVSLIGPRPEVPSLAAEYAEKVPYYNIRHIVKPGLSGWAQIYHEQHPHHGIDIVETTNKLSYDLYYAKHRSLLVDIKIALRTLKILITFAGR